MYKHANVFARRNNKKKFETPVKVLEKYNRVAVQFFIDFITSPTVMIGLPYSLRKVTTSDGTKHKIPDTVRQQTSTELFQMYGKTTKAWGRRKLLNRYTVFRIPDACAATKRKSATCVDYFTAGGMKVKN